MHGRRQNEAQDIVVSGGAVMPFIFHGFMPQSMCGSLPPLLWTTKKVIKQCLQTVYNFLIIKELLTTLETHRRHVKGGALRQRILGSHTPPCHRRMVITTLFSVLLAALQRRPVLYHTRWLLTAHWLWPSGH